MEVTLLGTGDTTGTPTPNCGCDTCRAARERGLERSRFSVHVHNERTGESLLVDASPDFRQQFLAYDVALPDAVCITHIHFDHLDGLGNAYRLLDDVPVYAPDETDPKTGESVAETVDRKYDYLDAVTVDPVSPLETLEVCGFEVTLVPVDHPPLLCYGLRVEDPETGAALSLSGDTSYAVPDRSRDVLEQAVGVAETVEVVEVDVRDTDGVGEGDVAVEELLAEVRAGVDEQRLAGGLVVDVHRKAGALDAALARRPAGTTPAVRCRRAGGVAGPQQRDLHRFRGREPAA